FQFLHARQELLEDVVAAVRASGGLGCRSGLARGLPPPPRASLMGPNDVYEIARAADLLGNVGRGHAGGEECADLIRFGVGVLACGHVQCVEEVTRFDTTMVLGSGRVDNWEPPWPGRRSA